MNDWASELSEKKKIQPHTPIQCGNKIEHSGKNMTKCKIWNNDQKKKQPTMKWKRQRKSISLGMKLQNNENKRTLGKKD